MLVRSISADMCGGASSRYHKNSPLEGARFGSRNEEEEVDLLLSCDEESLLQDEDLCAPPRQPSPSPHSPISSLDEASISEIIRSVGGRRGGRPHAENLSRLLGDTKIYALPGKQIPTRDFVCPFKNPPRKSNALALPPFPSLPSCPLPGTCSHLLCVQQEA